MSKVKLQNAYSTQLPAHKTPSSQEVETLKLQMSTYNILFTGETQDDACECLMLLIKIMDKEFWLCPTMTIYLVRGRFLSFYFHSF